VFSAAVIYQLIYNVQISDFLGRYLLQFTFSDLLMPTIKALLFGFAVGLISCYQGLRVERASTEVPQRTMHAVVYAVISIIVINIVVTLFGFSIISGVSA